MSEIVPPFKSARGRPPKYPWDLWSDGKAHKLYRGTADEVSAGIKDFEADLISFRTMVHRKARDLDMRANTHINKSDQSIKISFYK